jgi:hypothetical protein
MSVKKMQLLNILKKSFPDMVRLDDEGRFFFVDEQKFDCCDEMDRQLRESISQVEEGLLRLAVRRSLNELSKEFGNRVRVMDDRRARFRLQLYIMDHISVRLADMGFDETDFHSELAAIRDFPLGLSQEERAEVENQIEQEKEMLKEAERRVSIAYWLGLAAGSPGEVFVQLTTERLFELDSEDFVGQNEGRLRPMLKAKFKHNQVTLSSKATISQLDDDAWLVADHHRQYIVQKKDRSMSVALVRKEEETDIQTIMRIKKGLDQENIYAKWFEESGMNLSLDTREGGPLIIIGVGERPRAPRPRRSFPLGDA